MPPSARAERQRSSWARHTIPAPGSRARSGRHSLDAGELLTRLDASNRSASVGQIRHGQDQWPLRTVNQFTSLDEIRQFPIDARGLKLADVATYFGENPGLPVLTDPWGHDLVMTCDDKGFTVISVGPDGKQGTDDDVSP